MSDLVFALLLAALAGVTWWLVRSRDSRPMVLWVQGWAFLFASMAALLIGAEAPWPVAVVHLLGPFFPALLLAGTLAYAGRPVPRWLAPLAFALGIVRSGLGQLGLEQLDHGIALVFEAGFALAAASLAFRMARRSAGPRSQHLLAPAFLAIAAIEATDAIWGMRGFGLTAPHLIAWVLVGPFTLVVQLTVTRDRAAGRHRQVEQALGESEERFRALTDNAFDLVAEMDSEGRFTYANPRYEEWLGRPGATLIGTRGLDLVHPEDRERTLAWFRAEDTPGRGDAPDRTGASPGRRLAMGGDQQRRLPGGRGSPGRRELARRHQAHGARRDPPPHPRRARGAGEGENRRAERSGRRAWRRRSRNATGSSTSCA